MRLLLLIGIASLPAIAIVAYNEIELRHAREAEVRDQALRIARETAAELERTVEGVRGLLVTLAELPVIREQDGAACIAYLGRLRHNYPEYLVISVATAAGDVYCNSSNAARTPNVSDRYSFRQALATGGFAIGEYLVGRITDRKLIAFAYPIRDDAGRTIGATLAGVDLDWLGRHLALRSPSGDLALAVIDRNGTFLVRYPDPEKWVGHSDPQRLFDPGRAAGPRVGEDISADGVVQIGATVPIAFGPQTDLVVAIGLSKEAAFAAIDRATRRDIALIIAGLVLSVLAALLGGRYFLRRPIAQLAGAAARWREGDYGARARVRGRVSELSRLAETFDAMADALAQREAALRTADERLRLTASAIKLGTWDQDVATGERVWSEQVRRALGLPDTAPATLETLRNLIHPDDVGPSDVRYRAALDVANGGDYENEFRIRRYDDGSERWIALRGRIFFDATGKPIRAVGILFDITERKRADEAARRSEESLRLAVETTGLGLWEHDVQNRKLIWSDRTKAFLGLPPDAEVDYKVYLERIHPDDRERLVGIHRRALDPAGDGRFRSEHRAVLPDGSVHWLLASGQVLFDAERRPVRVLGGSIDITERKLAEEATQRINEILEERVGERTRALYAEMRQRQHVEATLRQAQKMQAVGQLAGGVAHDFNNLLTVVAGNLELLEQHLTHDPANRLLRSAMRAVDRGAQLTHRLLAFSRKQHLQPKPVDINGLISGMGDLLTRTLGGTIQVRMALSDGLWRALVDPTQIELALLNLAINSRDAMPDVGILTISTRNAQVAVVGEDLVPGDYIVLAVTDTGTGMNEDVVARAFEPFFTTKEVGKGTGLGLSQVYGVVNQLGGTVRLQSRIGEGTTVELYLPRSEAQAQDESEAQVAAARSREAVLMVVDDDPDVRELTVACLGQLGYGVVEAASGAAALALLDGDQTVDLLIADFAMPGMNGRVFVNEAKLRRPGLRVIFVTGYADAAALALEADEILLSKPFRVAELAREVANMLERPARAPSAHNVVPFGRAR
ncbi:MAG: PAS domain-containing protein [Proteobacteria bacterium]|nr:PAS domain-containing protein [Pseudomonadota bacterium]